MQGVPWLILFCFTTCGTEWDSCAVVYTVLLHCVWEGRMR